MEGEGQLGGAFMGSTGSGGDGDSLGRAWEGENDNRSGCDNLDGASANELDPDNPAQEEEALPPPHAAANPRAQGVSNCYNSLRFLVYFLSSPKLQLA